MILDFYSSWLTLTRFMIHYLKDRVFGITLLLDNVSFMRDQAVLIVTDCLFFNGPTKMLLLSKS